MGLVCLLTVGFLLGVPWCGGEVSSGGAAMEALLDTEATLLASLNSYTTRLEDRLRLLRKYYDEFNTEHKIAKKDVSAYLGNPVNAFKLVKRLHVDWNQTLNIMNTPFELERNLTELKKEFVFPNEEDLSGVSEVLATLQQLYELPISELAGGRIYGKQYSSPMTAKDSYELGYQLFYLRYYSDSFNWFTTALSKSDLEDSKDTISKSAVLEYLAYSAYMKGEVKTSLNTYRDLLELEPEHPRARKGFQALTNLSQSNETIPNKDRPKDYERYKNLAELCLDKMDLPEITKKDLKCHYLTRNDPFLRLAPVKVEEYYLNPYVAVFYDVISEREIKLIQETAKPRFNRSEAIDFNGGKKFKSRHRVSKTCWMREEEDEAVVGSLSRRVGRLTGLCMTSSESFQVVYYGPGGHFQPHCDFSFKDDEFGHNLKYHADGERIATFLFYLSDVEQGGRTVFPELGVGVTPRKGSALFWFNLHPSGEGNHATLHGACPVLQGSKWVANKWMHQRGQELRLPCNLKYEQEGLVKDYPKPLLKKHNLLPISTQIPNL